VRTTLTLDEDLYRRLRRQANKRNLAFKAMVNQLLRSALDAQDVAAPTPPFVVVPKDMGWRDDLDFDNIGHLLEQVDGPLHR